MDEWDAQKMLDLYIYDYLVRKNMHTTADILAQEADIHPKSVVINPPEGFLSEWWSLFWDVYSSRVPNNPQAGQGSSSQPPVNDGSLPQNAHPGSTMPDVSYMLQNICPTTPRTGLPNLLQTANPTAMPRPDMGSFLPNSFPMMMPNTNMSQEQMMAELLAQRAREQEHLRLPPRNLDANSNVINVDQLASMLPMAGSSSRRQKKVNNRRQHPVTNDVNYGTGMRRTIPSELTPHAPRLIQDDIGHADAGSSASSNSACPDTSS
ncbi:LEUNIG-like protein [Perilla frutescens var. hirtella]|nr:LEUNIG-like protein [Perilla frutescens var. hirtella]